MALGATVALLLLTAGAPGWASTVVHPFAGIWKTSANGVAGTLQINYQDPAKGVGSTAFESHGTARCASGATYYAGDYQTGGESGQIAGCSDASGDRLMLWYNSTPAGQQGIVTITVGAGDTSFSGSYTNTASKTTGRYTGTFTSDFDGSGRTAAGPTSVRLAVSDDSPPLLQPLTLTAKPTSAANYKFEIKPSNAPDWTILASGRSSRVQFVPRIAGYFDVRVSATTGTNAETSTAEQLVVTFPGAAEILRNPTVQQLTHAAWKQTLAAMLPSGTVQEFGFWTVLNTCTGEYRQTPDPSAAGAAVIPSPTVDPSIKLGGRPVDARIFRGGHLSCARYVVAQFHTHPGTLYSKYPRQPLGPSEEDVKSVDANQVPGLVYDYAAAPGVPDGIPAHYPKDAPARIYTFGKYEHRPTPDYGLAP
jgi:hypothetical protein